MELPQKMALLSHDFSRVWPKIHETGRNIEFKNIMLALKKINALMEDINLEILQIESTLLGDALPIERQVEFETSESAEKMFRQLLPFLMRNYIGE